LIWIGKNQEICSAEKETDSNGKEKILSRETARYYIRKHLYHYNRLLYDEWKNKRRAETAEWAFDRFEAGTLKKSRLIEGEDNMYDVPETKEEIALYDMTKRMRNTPLFDIS
jgi:hypothetical protein